MFVSKKTHGLFFSASYLIYKLLYVLEKEFDVIVRLSVLRTIHTIDTRYIV